MKICYIGWGHSIHLQRWIQWFAQFGHDVYLITDHPVPITGVTVHDISWKTDTRPRYIRYWRLGVNIRFIRILKTILKIRRLVKQISPDILHLHTLLYPAYLGVCTKFHPLVITPWNGDMLWSRKKSLGHNLLVQYALRVADLITHNSRQMKEKCIRRGVREKRLEMVQCPGVDLQRFYPQEKKEELKKRLALGGSPVVLSMRSISAEYNIEIVVKAIPDVLKKIPGTKFVFIWYFADGREIEKIKRLFEQLKIEPAVRFLGRIDDKDLPEYLNIADVFISVSSCDSAPMSLLEAMACGVAPITAELDPVNELVKDGWNGFIVPQRDPEATAAAMIKLLADEKTRKIFAQRNLEWVRENAGYDKNMKRVEELYLRLANKVEA
ncbi:MAG: glycosyltransferase family 4 protein [Candidatus Omnitrophota bacterium]